MASLAVSSTALAGSLQESAWRLLNISSMDDSIDVPDDPNKYTLAFGGEGRVAIRADCNRGTGTWTSESNGELTFGPIATTRAMCEPGSLSEKYLTQFEWVRSFTIRDGHLFLATMADGFIIEFEPLPPAVATLFGEPVHAATIDELQRVLVTALLDRYAAEQGIEVPETEVDAYLERMRRRMAADGLTAEDDLTEEEREQATAMRRSMGAALIRRWKINKSLYETYGGRIMYQQFGPEPLDAYRQYFEERSAAGDFSVDDPDMAEAFWSYFTDEKRHDFMDPDSEDAARAFRTPPWEGF
jgi:heat shock protein HslJ